jgi:alkanesulfonate monooxygenase SsuD/methylene tetrahydromethanopterin reductase-like flavin-dependent oxidoreductase (luciferase family)
MKFYLSLASSGFAHGRVTREDVSNTIKIAIIAEELGYEAILLPDHYMLPYTNKTLDTWVALTYMAAKTEKIRLGSIVTPLPFRPPGMLAKIVSTLDILSSGRVILGVGAGWSQPEFEGYSKWNDAKTRVDKTEEGLKLILQLWTEDVVNFKGRFYSAKRAVLEPKPIQKPYPTLLFGTTGTRMLRLAGRYGNIWHTWDLKDAPQKMEIVRSAAERYNRISEIDFAYTGGTLEDVEEAERLGAKYFLVNFGDIDTPSHIKAVENFAKNVRDKINK